MWKMVKRFRWLVYVILPFILSTISFGEMTVTQYEVGGYTRNTVNSRSQLDSAQTPDLEAKLREALELLEQPNPNRAKIGKLIGEIEELDQKIRADFAATENELRGKNVSATILKRHQDFVAQYQENMETLKEGLKVYDPGFLGMNQLFSLGEDSKAKEAKVKDIKKKLKDKWIPKEFNPFKDGQFPKKNTDFKPREPQLYPSITPAYDYTLKSQSLSKSSFSTMSNGSFVTQNFNGADNYGATPEDLQETIEIQLTPEIKELARELDYNPVKIYEYVHNNIDYAPYYGSVKGAQETLWQKSGNDFDQASLLMALLRASGIPCRYVYGVVEIPMEKVKNWIGIEHDQTALNTFPTNGIPAKGIYIGEKAAFLRKEHVWVEALVPVNHYRGSGVDDSGKGWVPMDPSFKQYEEKPKLDLQSEVPFDVQAFINQIQSNAAIGDNGASITNVDQNYIQQKMDEYQQAVKSYIEKNYPDATVDDLLGGRKIIASQYSILPLSLPYQIVSIQKEFSASNDSYRHKIGFQIENPNDFPGGSSCSYTGTVPDIGSKRISIAFIAATEADAELLASYLPEAHTDGTPIQPGELPASFPAYLIKVKPQIIVDGTVVATGNPVTMGTQLDFYMDFIYPTYVNEPMQHLQNQVTAGGFYVVTLDTGSISANRLINTSVGFKTTINNIQAGNITATTSESLGGQFLQAIGLKYFAQLDLMNRIVEKQANVRALRVTSEAITSIDCSVKYLFGMPRNLSISGLAIDVDRDLYSVRSINGDNQNVKQFFTVSGPYGSYLEGSVFEEVFGGQGISTIHILNIANSQGIKIYHLDSSNVNAILPNLQYNDDQKQMLRNLIFSGKEITIPEREVTIGGWTGTGYEVINPEDGSGAYMIAGGISGGAILWQNLCSFVVGLAINLGSLFTKEGLGAVLGSVSVITSIATAFDDINKSSDLNVYVLDVLIMLTAMFALACLAAFAFGLVGSMMGCTVFTVIGTIVSWIRERYIKTHPGALGKVDILKKNFFKRTVVC